MSGPVRIQRKRTKGFNLEMHSRELNGLWPIYVGRPTRWGNPFTINLVSYTAVSQFRRRMTDFEADNPDGFEAFIAPLRGRNLACWCDLRCECHADVLLEFANASLPHSRGLP